MKIVFDLDYTLLDTEAFKKALVKAVCGDDARRAERYEKAYAEVGKENAGLFIPDALFEKLRGEFPGERELAAARDAFEAVLHETERFLYPGAKELLRALGAHRDAKVELMTFGNAEWQKAKVGKSGLHDLFRDVLYAEKEKREFIRDIGEGEDKVIVVNDNGREMEEMMAAAPEYAYILKKGPKPVPEDVRLPTAETMEALAALLERETGWELRREMREMGEATEARVIPPGEEVRGSIDMGAEETDERGDHDAPRDAGRPGARL